MLNPNAPCALFFDYDGTLCFDGTVSEENRLALAKAQAAGHQLFLNTGRSKACIPPEILSFPWNGLVAGVSYAELNGEVLLDEPLSRDCLKEAYEVHRR